MASMDPAGKVALITGGRRIGQTVADALARRGCHVAVSYRASRSEALSTVQRIKALGVRALAIRADVRRPNDVQFLLQRAVRALGRLDILVNMASVYERTPLAELSRAAVRRKAFNQSVDVDLRSAYELSLAAFPLLKKLGGRIINFSDWVADSGRPRYRGYIPYYTAKAAVKGLTEALALELAPSVLVNAIAPGPILPPKGLPASAHQEVVAHTPLGRWGGAEEIAKAVLFFVESDFVTGETLRVDGGRHLY